MSSTVVLMLRMFRLTSWPIWSTILSGGWKGNREEHHKVINTLTAKVIALEQCVEDVQRKAFPQVGKWPKLPLLLLILLPCRLLLLFSVSRPPLCLVM
jgi:hypothetical protein